MIKYLTWDDTVGLAGFEPAASCTQSRPHHISGKSGGLQLAR
jgi:hypothetical protein